MSEAVTGKAELQHQLRHMIAVLEKERQALAGLDLEALVLAATDKQMLCDHLDPITPGSVDDECRMLAETARQLNDVNRRLRNLLAANVAARLDALGGKPAIYRPTEAIPA